ncbi:MAG: hypothetical protein NTZ20_05505 [Candidatus Levybacteria bacterium]|nr:hypothetical protein [Candidatus Levybacteria bacterium]
MNTATKSQPTKSLLPNTKGHYVNNKKLYEAFVVYKKAVRDAEANNKSAPKIPDYIGECILTIAQRLSQKYNFALYSFKQEMISDGIENCFQYLNNFDPDKSNNPFAYFTQIIRFAFIRRIQKERKQTYIKHQITQMQVYSSLRPEIPFDVDDTFATNYENMLVDKRVKAKERIKRLNEKNDGESGE